VTGYRSAAADGSLKSLDYWLSLFSKICNVPASIEPADPMIGVGSGAYAISFGERQ
jgi:hypothetical protein